MAVLAIKIAKNCDQIDMLRRFWGDVISSIGHSSPYHLPGCFTYPFRGSPPCAIFHHPDNNKILHSNVLIEAQVGIKLLIQMSAFISSKALEVQKLDVFFFLC